MDIRKATPEEEIAISDAKAILLSAGLYITGLKDGNDGAVIPAKGF